MSLDDKIKFDRRLIARRATRIKDVEVGESHLGGTTAKNVHQRIDHNRSSMHETREAALIFNLYPAARVREEPDIVKLLLNNVLDSQQ